MRRCEVGEKKGVEDEKKLGIGLKKSVNRVNRNQGK